MGIAARREKDYARALRAYDRALSFNPDDPVLHYNKAMVFAAQRFFRSALALLKKAVDLDPDFGEAREARRILLETVTAPLRRGRRVVSLAEETRVAEDVEEGGL